jgi:uncharacterized protein (DUF433 family)
MSYSSVVTISPEIQSGTPVFRGTRVPIKIVFDYLRGGESINDFVRDYPSVRVEQVQSLLTYTEKLYALSLGDVDSGVCLPSPLRFLGRGPQKESRGRGRGRRNNK